MGWATWLSGRSRSAGSSGCPGSPVPHRVPAPTPRTFPVPEGLTLALPAVLGLERGGERPSRALPLPATGHDPTPSLVQGFSLTLQPLCWAPLCHLQSLSTRTGPGVISPAMRALGLAAPTPGAGMRPCLGCLCRHEEERLLSQLQ